MMVVLVGVSITCARAGVTIIAATAATRVSEVMGAFICVGKGEPPILHDVSRDQCRTERAGVNLMPDRLGPAARSDHGLAGLGRRGTDWPRRCGRFSAARRDRASIVRRGS